MLTKTAGEVVTETIMLSAAKPQYSVLIVEGVDDFRFWRSRVVSECLVVYAGGKTIAKDAVGRLNGRGFGRHIGVFDRDYDDMGEVTDIARNRIFWDAHSLETVLFLSQAGDKVLAEFLDPLQVDVLEQKFGCSIKNLMISSIERFGRVRFLHHQQSGQIEVEATTLHRVFPVGGGHELTNSALFAEAARCGAVPSVVQAPAKLARIHGWDARYLIRGHDVAVLLNIYGREMGVVCAPAAVEGALRLAFERVDLEATTVYADLLKWEAVRPPYKVVSRAVH